MDRQKAEQAFKNYSENYDTSDIKITLKINHTYRVAAIADRIAGSLGADPDFAWFTGLLHDIGRFEQLTRYGTFKDARSIDHAELGADILFKGDDPLIKTFPDDLKIPKWSEIAETAIRLHNKLTLPEDMDEHTRLYSTILRDADKCDIFRVLTEPPYDERNKRAIESLFPARDEVMICIKEHRCVPRNFERTEFEALLSQCCMAFELEYPESRKVVSEQGYLEKLLNVDISGEAGKQIKMLRSELNGIIK
ncbi:MAG: HD domain-containing protein [Lachnospiraceae bacterium]|nr:HD domain-containing protein [Lachnospiraceae bacterium]